MFRRTVSGIMVAFLLVGMLTLAFNIKPVKASETIYIRADGSIDPPTAPISTLDNITYSFIGNVNGSVVIERSNIIVDGNDFMVQGPGSGNGLYLRAVSDVTIKKVNVKGFDRGVCFDSSSHNTLSESSITANPWYGILLYSYSNYNSISGNNITNNKHAGIYLTPNSNYNSISGNNIINDTDGILVGSSSSYNSISGNNITANNMEGIYLLESSYNNVSGNKIANNRYGILIICYSNHNNHHSISGNEITGNRYGIYLSDSSSNSISGNNITANNGYGIAIWSSYNSISGNKIANNGDGIYVDGSYNDIFGNNITASSGCGIDLEESSNNVSGNTFANDGLYVRYSYLNTVENNTVNGRPLVYLEGIADYSVGDAGQVILVRCDRIRVENLNLSRTSIGVELLETNNTIIFGNNIADNGEGIELRYSSNNSVSGNNITANNMEGIYLFSSNYNSISGNNITKNGIGIELRKSFKNRFYHNNIIQNTRQVYDLSWDNPESPPSINTWDDGYPSGGNYWSDYTGVDVRKGSNQDEPGSDGIGDTPYTIDANNQDCYPLMCPYGSPPPPTYSLTITTDANGTTNPAPGTYTYSQGQSVPVQAVPNTGYGLDHWELDGVNCTDNPISVTMDKDHTLHAVFRIHDVAVTNVTLSKTIVKQGDSVNINVTVAYQGLDAETFNVTVYANMTSIASQTVTLDSGNSTTLTFTWNITGSPMDTYTITAEAEQVEGETHIEDNRYTDGTITVTWLGDSDGDLDVDEEDLWYFCAYFITYHKYGYMPRMIPFDFDHNYKIDEDDLWTMCAAFIDYWKQH